MAGHNSAQESAPWRVVQMWGEEGRVVPGDIIVPKVICYYQDYVGFVSSSSRNAGSKEQKHEREIFQVCHNNQMASPQGNLEPFS